MATAAPMNDSLLKNLSLSDKLGAGQSHQFVPLRWLRILLLGR
jgi:hypothetical protein